MKEKLEYIINRECMGFLPMDSPVGDLWTIIIEMNQSFIVKKKPMTIINESCHWFGTSYDGSKSSVLALTSYKSGVPVSISGELGICLFPLASPKRRDTLWLSHSHIKDWVMKDKESTTVRFINYQVMDLPIAKASLDLRVCRTAQYRHMLRENMEEYKIPREEINREQTADLNHLFNKKDNGTYFFQAV